jgi:hypothetical protein
VKALSRGKGRRRSPEGLLPAYDYDESSVLTGYSASYLRKLCDLRRLSYVLLVYYRGHKMRRVRKIPLTALEALIERRYKPAIQRHPPRRAAR